MRPTDEDEGNLGHAAALFVHSFMAVDEAVAAGGPHEDSRGDTNLVVERRFAPKIGLGFLQVVAVFLVHTVRTVWMSVAPESIFCKIKLNSNLTFFLFASLVKNFGFRSLIQKISVLEPTLCVH